MADSLKNDVDLAIRLLNTPGQPTAPQTILTRIHSLIETFELSPKQLDAVIPHVVSVLSAAYLDCRSRGALYVPVASGLAETVYLLAKIRGYKFVANQFPSDVYCLSQILHLLEDESLEQFDLDCYLLLLWLSRLVLVPFPLNTVAADVPTRIYAIARKFLSVHSNASKTQVVALALVALYLNRSDCALFLSDFKDSILTDWPSFPTNQKLGHLMALNQLLKHQSNLLVKDFAPRIYRQLIVFELRRIHVTQRENSLNVRYLIKTATKIAVIYTADSQYDELAGVFNLLISLLKSLGDGLDASLRETLSKNMAKIVSQVSFKAVNYASQMIDFVLRQLRLPLEDAAELEIRTTEVSVPRYHVVLSFVGFLALTKSLPLHTVPTVLKLCHKTCFISSRDYFVQGSHIRDASCFCLWALFRQLRGSEYITLSAVSPDIFQNCFADLVTVALFDEDYTIRRSAVAVLQEYIGRFGNQLFQSLFQDWDCHKLGAFTIQFVEQLGSVGSLEQTHETMERLVAMNLSSEMFLAPLLSEITSQNSSFGLVKLGSRYLVRLMSGTSSFSSVLGQDKKLNVIRIITKTLEDGSPTMLYTLGEIHRVGLLDKYDHISANLLNPDISTRSGDDVVESFLHWVNCIRAKMAVTELVAGSRTKATAGVTGELQAYFQSTGISDDEFSLLVDEVRLGNRNLAGSISHCKTSPDKVAMLRSLLLAKNIDCEMKATLLTLLDLTRWPMVDDAIALLDDYTTDSRGDIGLLVRQASLLQIGTFPDLFSDKKELFLPKILRIAGEPIDKLRGMAFQYLTQTPASPSYDVYFKQFRDYFHGLAPSPEMHRSYWLGLMHSAGALTGSGLISALSFGVILQDFEDDPGLYGLVLTMLKSLTVKDASTRDQKSLLSVLGVIAKLLDCNVYPAPEKLETLFVRAYNLHINTSNTARVALVLRVFEHLVLHQATNSALKKKAWSRLCWVACQHTHSQTRYNAAESLYTIANELCNDVELIELLSTTEWFEKIPGQVYKKLSAFTKDIY